MEILIIIILLILIVWFFNKKCDETFEIEPNTVTGGYDSGPSVFELEGPGDAAWSGY